jgi:hypothetical protein
MSKPSPWRFLKLAITLRAEKPSYHHVLCVLADYANSDGKCYPSYEQLMERTGYASKHTITDALKHWRDAGVLTWTKGWGNLHGKRANTYQFHEGAMERQIGAQKASRDESALSADESALGADESAVTPVSECTDCTLTSHLSTSHISTSHSSNAPFSFKGVSEEFSDNQATTPTAGPPTRKGPMNGESAINTLSSESAPDALSSPSPSDALSRKFKMFCEGMQ